MEIKIFFVFSLFCILLAFFAGCGGPIDNCCPLATPEPNYSIITNATDSDAILGYWVRPNDKMIQMPFIIFYRDAYVSKGKGIDRSIVIGRWTKLDKNEYFIRWTGERNDNFDITNWSDSINETVAYKSSPEIIYDRSGSYIRYNVSMEN